MMMKPNEEMPHILWLGDTVVFEDFHLKSRNCRIPILSFENQEQVLAQAKNDDSTFGQKILDISQAQAKTIIKPHSITDDWSWETMTGIARPIRS